MSAETSGEPMTVATPYRDAPRAVPKRIPASATSFVINSVGAVGLIAAIVILRWLNQNGTHIENRDRVLILLGATAIPIGILDLLVLKVYRRASTGLDWEKDFSPSVARVVTKLLGLGATVAAIAFLYWTFPEYRGSFYDPYYSLLRRFAAPLVLFSVLYFVLIDGVQKDPKDSYWQLGRALLGSPGDASGKDLANHARGWLVKLFFLPLMVVYAHDSTRSVIEWHLDGASLLNMRLYQYLYEAIFFGDLAFCVIGYVLSLRLMDSHCRTAEPTVVGWAVALFCYQPFFSLFENNYVHYEDNSGFDDWIQNLSHVMGTTGMEWVRAGWAVLVLALIVIYVLATVTFGWRFSNLTHRGILTNGPYRFTKHPAYIAKNLSWWMTSVPWVLARTDAMSWPVHAWQSARHCLLLACVNWMYFMRARTEERHLSRDPVYVEYALWMNEHGMFAWFGKLFPFFRYVQPMNPPPITAKQEEEQRAALAAEATASAG